MSKALKGLAVAGLIVVTGGAAIGGLVAAGAITSVAVATAAINAVVGLAAMTALNGISAALAKNPKSSTAGNSGIQMESNDADGPRLIVYGRQRLSGSLVIPWITTGTDNAFLHQVITIAGHEIDAFETYHVNDTETVTPGSITGTANDGLVSTGAYANLLWLRGYRGTASQTVDYILDTALAEWTSDHRGRGVAYLAGQFKYSESVYRSGKPDLSVTIRGKKCYDPRLDSTNGGSGSHRLADPTTWAWTANPALCLADYLIDDALGLGESSTLVDWTLVAAAANTCDENVTIPNGLGGSTTQKRYECHVTLAATDDYASNKAVLESAMLGSCIWSNGKWRMRAGAWPGTLFTLTDEDVAGSFSVTTEIRNGEKYNDVRGLYFDASDLHRQKPFQPRFSTAYQTSDGEVKPRTVQFVCWTNEYMAQRGAIILLRQSRGKQTITVECKLSAFKIRPGETGTATFSEIGWSSQACRCVNWEFMPEGMVKLTLRQEASTDWTDPTWNTDYTVPGTVVTPSAGFTRPGTPTAFTLTPIPSGIEVSLVAGDPTIPGQRYRVYRNSVGGTFAGATIVWDGTATSFAIYASASTAYDYWVTAIYQGNESGPRPSGAGTTATALSRPSAGRALNSDPYMREPSAWTLFNGSAPTFTTIADGIFGPNVMRSPNNGESWMNASDRIPVNLNSQYRISGYARRTSAANGTLYLGLAAFTSAGSNISGDGTQWSYDAAPAATGSVGSWTYYEAVVGFDTANTFPNSAQYITPLAILNYAGTSGYYECQGVKVEEITDTTLISSFDVTQYFGSDASFSGGSYGNTAVHCLSIAVDAPGVLRVIADVDYSTTADWDAGNGLQVQMEWSANSIWYGTHTVLPTGRAPRQLYGEFTVPSSGTYTLRTQNYKAGGTTLVWDSHLAATYYKR